MNVRPSRQTVAILVVCCAVAVLCFSQETVGHVPVGATGRFQMTVTDHHKIYVLDVNTGECWVKHYMLSGEKTKWIALDSPVSEQAAEQAPDVDVIPPD